MPSILKSIRSLFSGTRKKKSLTEEQKESIRSQKAKFNAEVAEHVEYLKAVAKSQDEEKARNKEMLRALEERLRRLRQQGGGTMTRRKNRQVPKLRTLNVKTRYASLTY